MLSGCLRSAAASHVMHDIGSFCIGAAGRWCRGPHRFIAQPYSDRISSHAVGECGAKFRLCRITESLNLIDDVISNAPDVGLCCRRRH